ncbi:LysE family translocator [Kinneretia aquatilis]|uniref:LysE family translocator n=1 Tax=Kinneretia aquatilis TaxID=2070761 RepID=UPI0014951108|nr:LysE family transporter [Paucibacter aquatile]WIV97130.1 LysE family transporter [Paucibacter aquatile]
MENAVWMSMELFALAGAISPGPVNVMASAAGAAQGFVRAMPLVLGASLSYGAVVWLAGSGLQISLVAHPQLARLAPLAGAAYLLLLAWRIATAPPGAPTGAPTGALAKEAPPHGTTALRAWTHGLLQGALTQGLNPKAWLVALSGVGLFVPSGPEGATRLQLFCAISLLVCWLSVSTWAALGLWIRRWLARPAYQRGFNRLLAALLLLTIYGMLAGG